MERLAWKNKWGKWSTAHIVDHEDDDVVHFLCGQTLNLEEDAVDLDKNPDDVCGRCTNQLEDDSGSDSWSKDLDMNRGTTKEIRLEHFEPDVLCPACRWSYDHRNLIWLCRSNDCRHRIGYKRIARRDGKVFGLKEE